MFASAGRFTSPGFLGSVMAAPKPVTPAASTTAPSSSARPGRGLFTFIPPGQSLGRSPAPLASPSLGLAMTPSVAMFAAIAGAHAVYTATGSGTTTTKPGGGY